MNIYKKVLENRFFLRILLTYCLIIVAGIVATAYLLTSGMANSLIEAESKYEKEIVQKVSLHVEGRFKQVDKILQQLYTPNYYSPGITDLLEPIANAGLTDDERGKSIMTNMQSILGANGFVSDMMIVDYTRKNVYFYSNQAYRDVSLNYDFFSSPLYHQIQEGINEKVIIPNHVPDYVINSFHANNYPVISVFINLYDVRHGLMNTKVGAVILNINPEVFSGAYLYERGIINGKIMIMDSSGNVYLDSTGELTGKNFQMNFLADTDIPHTIKSGNTLINYIKSGSTGLVYMNAVDTKDIYKDVNKLKVRALNIIVICILFAVAISAAALRIFTRRIGNLVKHMRMVEEGALDTRVRVGSNDEIGYMEKSFNSMCDRLQDYIRSVYLSQIRLKTAELKALQAQINPHFMFNTLESIRLMALVNKDAGTARMIHILGNMFRWNIRMKNMIVDISDEVEYISSYIELQKVRYENSFSVSNHIDDEVLQYAIPKLVLQPVVENAIYHGLGGKKGDGHLEITGILRGNTVEISIADNGEGMDEQRLQKVIMSLDGQEDSKDLYNIGLSNVQQRIVILFGQEFGIKVSSQTGSGTCVTITVPALGRKEMEAYVQSNHSR